MDLLQLRYFCTAAKNLNISQAAREHYIPQSAMSKSIKRLENELGVKLFERMGNRITLSETGKEFLQKIEQLLFGLDEAVRSLRAEEGAISGEIRVLVKCNRRIVTDCIADFNQKYHDVSFFVCHDLYNDQKSGFDFCICDNDSVTDPDSQRQVLLNEEIVLAVPKNHKLANEKSVAIHQLATERFILLPPGSSMYGLTRKICLAEGFYPKTSILCDDPYYIRKYVSAGLGVSLIPSVSWKGLFDEKTVLIPISGGSIFRTIVITWDNTKFMSSAAELFKKELLKRFLV